MAKLFGSPAASVLLVLLTWLTFGVDASRWESKVEELQLRPGVTLKCCWSDKRKWGWWWRGSEGKGGRGHGVGGNFKKKKNSLLLKTHLPHQLMLQRKVTIELNSIWYQNFLSVFVSVIVEPRLSFIRDDLETLLRFPKIQFSVAE